jgi:hypothetical protein
MQTLPWLEDHGYPPASRFTVDDFNRLCDEQGLEVSRGESHYAQFGWGEEPAPYTKDGWPYWWPTEEA